MQPARLTYGRVRRFVSFLVGAHSPSVQQGVQRLLLAAARQAAQALGAGPGVNPARLPLGQRARQAAAAARLLDQLAANRDRRAHGQRLLVTRLARHVRAQTAGQPQDKCHQEANTQNHCRAHFSCSINLECEEEEEKSQCLGQIIRFLQLKPGVFIQERCYQFKKASVSVCELRVLRKQTVERVDGSPRSESLQEQRTSSALLSPAQVSSSRLISLRAALAF